MDDQSRGSVSPDYPPVVDGPGNALDPDAKAEAGSGIGAGGAASPESDGGAESARVPRSDDESRGEEDGADDGGSASLTSGGPAEGIHPDDAKEILRHDDLSEVAATHVPVASDVEFMEDDGGEADDREFRLGDHVYIWCSVAFIPGVFQHHGIVVGFMEEEVEEEKEEEGECECEDEGESESESESESEGGAKGEAKVEANGPESGKDGAGAGKKRGRRKRVIISDFHGFISGDKGSGKAQGGSGSFGRDSAPSGMRSYAITEEVAATKWKKVRYSAGWARRTFQRSGTCTAVPTDPPGVVLSRVRFLLENRHLVPPYHILRSNCECVAVWCKTGQWSTLQGSSFLHATAAGQVKGTSTVALFAAAQQTTVTVPASGLWGWLGGTTTTTVPLVSTNPLIMPAIAAYGIVTIGGPVAILHACRKYWRRTTEELNDAFWAGALERPDEFAERITKWSDATA